MIDAWRLSTVHTHIGAARRRAVAGRWLVNAAASTAATSWRADGGGGGATWQFG